MMWRILVYTFAAILLVAGMTYFADGSGTVLIDWRGYEIEASVYVTALAVLCIVFVALLIWSFLRYLAGRPEAAAGRQMGQMRNQGLLALSNGMIALNVGDREGAERQAALAVETLPDDPLTALLQARNAEARGDRKAAQRIFADMARNKDTELLGLRGLFHQAIQDNEIDAARQYAERAVRLNPKLGWGVEALFDLDCQLQNWDAAIEALAQARQHGLVDREAGERRRAVLLTAKAMDLRAKDAAQALELAFEAHKLAPDLVPAAKLVGTLLSTSGQATRAQRFIARTWRLSPHPDLADAYANTPTGASAHERLKRIRELADLTPRHEEAALAVADAAIEAREWQTARRALGTLIDGRPSVRVCSAMARIENGEFGGNGRVHEWLSRGVRAPRDPVWTADGIVAEEWAPISPVSGRLDAFEWKVPYEVVEKVDESLTIEMPDQSGSLKKGAKDKKAGDAKSKDQEAEDKVAKVVPIPIAGSDKDKKPKDVADLEAEDIGPDGKPKAADAKGGSDTSKDKSTEFYVPPRPPDDPGPIAPEKEKKQEPAATAQTSKS